MPPLMAEFARRLDEGKPFSFGGNLSIGWSGLPDDPAVCTWDDGRIYFQNNALAAGLAVEQIQGQMTDISGRRGQMLGSDTQGRKVIIRALIPQVELSRYAIDLRAFSHGAASFSRKFVRYEPMPDNIAAKLKE